MAENKITQKEKRYPEGQRCGERGQTSLDGSDTHMSQRVGYGSGQRIQPHL